MASERSAPHTAHDLRSNGESSQREAPRLLAVRRRVDVARVTLRTIGLCEW